MGFLAPWYLLLAGAVAVPLLIHLLRRKVGRRVEFPAARYLARAEQEHSRNLRIRNLLLMLLRVLAVLAIALAAARPAARWLGAGHAPTALAVVVDNSLSSSAIVGGAPLLDQFKTMARDVFAHATGADRLWLVTIDGNVRGGTADVLRDEVSRLEPLAGAGDPAGAITRAASVVGSSGLPARQLALLTDGQKTEWEHMPSTGNAQILVYAPRSPPPANRAVTLAEPRPARWTPSGAVAARFSSRDSTTYRITLGGRTVARGTAAPNEEVTVRTAPPERGWVAGTVELEPDELAGDNTRHFAVWIGPAPAVSVSQSVGPFVASATDVLRTSSRVVSGNDIAVVAADELTRLPALIIAPADPVRLGAANRALERAGVPWRFGARKAGQTDVRGAGFEGVSATSRYELVAQPGAVADTLASSGADAWIVAGPRYVIVASPLTPDATSFPVRASFVPWLGTMLTERLVGDAGRTVDASPGARISRPRWADAMEGADGQRVPLGETIDVPARPGAYFLTRAGRRAGALVVNAPPGESILDRYTPAELRALLPADRALIAGDPAGWSSMAFRGAARRSLVGPTLLFALLMIVIEAMAIRARSRSAA
jgi:hypothetical protein